jgi:hypothetical protein
MHACVEKVFLSGALLRDLQDAFGLFTDGQGVAMREAKIILASIEHRLHTHIHFDHFSSPLRTL